MAETDGSQCVVNLNGNGAASYQRSEVQQTKDEVDKNLAVDEIGKAFKKFDRNEDGHIDPEEMQEMLEQLPEDFNINTKALAASVVKRHDVDGDRRLDLEEFREAMNRSFIGNRLNLLMENIVPRRRQRTVEDRIKLCPPPLGIFIVSLVQIFFFVWDETHSLPVGQDKPSNSTTGFMKKDLQYSPNNRPEVWRFLTYMFSHSGILHIVANLFIQLPLGIILEYLNSWWRVLIVYLAGVLSGSLGASIVNPHNGLVGASAGGYALLFAFIPNFILNWTEMKNRVLYFLMFTVCFTFLTLPSIVNFKTESSTSHISHLSGAVAGMLVGFVVLTNIEVEPYERKLQKVAALIFGFLVTTAIFIHLFHANHFKK